MVFLISDLTDAMDKTKSASTKEATLCLEEQDATTLWDKTVNTPESRAEAAGNRAARMAAKKELAGALANRLKVLQAFLDIQALLAVFLVFLSIVLHLVGKPFDMERDNTRRLHNLEFTALTVCFCTFWGGLFFFWFRTSDTC